MIVTILSLMSINFLLDKIKINNPLLILEINALIGGLSDIYFFWFLGLFPSVGVLPDFSKFYYVIEGQDCFNNFYIYRPKLIYIYCV